MYDFLMYEVLFNLRTNKTELRDNSTKKEENNNRFLPHRIYVAYTSKVERPWYLVSINLHPNDLCLFILAKNMVIYMQLTVRKGWFNNIATKLNTH